MVARVSLDWGIWMCVDVTNSERREEAECFSPLWLEAERERRRVARDSIFHYKVVGDHTKMREGVAIPIKEELKNSIIKKKISSWLMWIKPNSEGE